MKDWYEITNKAGRAEIRIYDDIGGGFFGEGVTAKGFLKDLRDVPDDQPLDLHIDSRGGSVSDGFAIFNMLKERAGDVDVSIDGTAASIASVIAMAGTSITMPKAALMMIHDPRAMVEGTASEMRKMAGTLDKVTGQIAEAYADRTGRDIGDIKELMAAETWMDGRDALKQGFIDSLNDQKPVTNKFDLTVFSHAPSGAKRLKTLAGDKPPPVKNKTAKKIIMETLLNALAELGLVAKGVENEAEAVRQLQTNWSEQATDLKAREELEKQNADLSVECAQLRNEKASILVDAAIRDGRVAKEKRSEWIKVALASGDTIKDVLESIVVSNGDNDPVPPRKSGNKTILDQYNELEPGEQRAKFRAEHQTEIEAALVA